MGTSPSKPDYSIVVAPAVGDKGEIRRLAANKDVLTTPKDLDPTIVNTYDILLRGVRVSRKAPCFGRFLSLTPCTRNAVY